MNDLSNHQFFMHRAVLLAQNGSKLTSPNPTVGALLVKNGEIIGRGWHRKAGEPHAEIEAIRFAQKLNRQVRGSTLYVTLEPCSTWGRTPPCTDAILEAGIKVVVVGCVDPNPLHSGKGLEILRKNKIKVIQGILEEDCRALNTYWNHWIVHRMPWVVAKCGMSLDGKIAATNGESKWITSGTARNHAHRLRENVDGILVGIGTILTDNPSLSLHHGRFRKLKTLWKIVLDRRARTPPDSRIFDQGRVWIFCSKNASSDFIRQLKTRGAKITFVPEQNAKLDLKAVLKTLARNGITSILVEGGGKVLGSFFYEKLVHEFYFYVAPKIVGGVQAKRAIEGPGFSKWNDALTPATFNTRRIGSDFLFSGII